VAVNEQAPVGDEHCVERLTYGGADHWQLNGCGQLIRHDDSAGTIEISAFGLTGQALGQTRRFLTNLDTPHWPDSESMLERKENSSAWAYDAFGAQLTQMDAGSHTQQKTFTIGGQLKSVSLQISGEDEQGAGQRYRV
jgi:insecticidal toxin complex protein TccC